MKYILMHKNISVAELEIDEATSVISSIGSVFAENHVPIGIAVKDNLIDRSALNEWWRGRSIPASRDGLGDALLKLDIAFSERLIEKCFGLSLSDQYWINPENSGLIWDEINFFNNKFSEDIGDVLFGQPLHEAEIDFMSPDNTSDGWLKKRWQIIDGKRCLIKGGSGVLQQEPYNEVIASAVLRRLNIPHVGYSLMMQEEYPYSVCENFITSETELISAWDIMKTLKRLNHMSTYDHFINCCDKLGIPNATSSMNKMLSFDFLIANEDRHFRNFGAVRNADTLEFIGIAPIFDNGTSLWCNTPTALIRPSSPKLPSKPFKTTHHEQIGLVKSFDLLDISTLSDIDEEIRKIFKNSVFIDESRQEALCSAINKRIIMLYEYSRNYNLGFFTPSEHLAEQSNYYIDDFANDDVYRDDIEA
jgi:hypothetical protein